jgi:hypothetical protein
MYHGLKNQLNMAGTPDEFAYCFKKRDRDDSGFLSAKSIKEAFEDFMNMKKRPNEERFQFDSAIMRDIMMTLNQSKNNSNYPFRDILVHLFGLDLGNSLYLKDVSDFDIKKPKANEK